ncbi:phage head-tail adapter protein [Cytobacillus sp. FSL R5-0569]|uniref:phage head-tail adapter protein n=1 Tax=Cytobacillus sp. FSL R5-0569 TaxID=2921649 RepID=UPI0030F63483
MKFNYKSPRTTSGNLNTPITFYRFTPNDGPEPGERKKEVIFNAFCSVDTVWMKDIEVAKANGTLTDLTIKIRDTQGEYVPSNEDYFTIESVYYKNGNEPRYYNIESVKPDLANKDFIIIIGRLTEI